MVRLSPLDSPATWREGSSTHPPWQNLGLREGSAHGEPRAGTSCGPIPSRVVRALPWQGVSSLGAGNSFHHQPPHPPPPVRLPSSPLGAAPAPPPPPPPPPPPSSTTPATSVLRTGDSEPSPVHAVPEWENPKSSPSGGGLGGIDFGSLERNLSHIWKQTFTAGRCVEVHTSRTQFPPSGPNPNSVPLRGAERNWSTLGGILDPLLRL
jgi:hypothetical protein